MNTNSEEEADKGNCMTLAKENAYSQEHIPTVKCIYHPTLGYLFDNKVPLDKQRKLMEQNKLRRDGDENSMSSYLQNSASDPQGSLLDSVVAESKGPLHQQGLVGTNLALQNSTHVGSHAWNCDVNEGSSLPPEHPRDDYFSRVAHWGDLETIMILQESQQQVQLMRQNTEISSSQVRVIGDQHPSHQCGMEPQDVEAPLLSLDLDGGTIPMGTESLEANPVQQTYLLTSGSAPAFSSMGGMGNDNSPPSLVTNGNPANGGTPPKKKKRAAQIQDTAGWKWRKQGQKIRKHGSIRSYYRCTMKESGCTATLIVDTDVVGVNEDGSPRVESRWVPKEEHNHRPSTGILDENRIKSFLNPEERRDSESESEDK